MKYEKNGKKTSPIQVVIKYNFKYWFYCDQNKNIFFSLTKNITKSTLNIILF